jgi:hypothetical protein
MASAFPLSSPTRLRGVERQWAKTRLPPRKYGGRRYIGSLVGDFHRTLLYGGIYGYATTPPGLLGWPSRVLGLGEWDRQRQG